MSKQSAQEKLKKALALINFCLLDLDEVQKERYCLSRRKGKVFQILDEDGTVCCTYSTLGQVKRFISKKIGEINGSTS
jgi:hypothetical protein